MCTRWLLMIGTALLAAILTGCSTITSGHGTSGPTPSTPAPTAASTSPTTTATTQPATHPLNCPAGAIPTNGAPFCYPLPAGFTDYSTLSTYGRGWTYRTLVAIGKHDLIEVLGYRLSSDTDVLGQAALEFLYQSQRLVVGKLNVVQSDSPQPSQVDGARAFVQQAKFKNGVRTLTTTVYRGRTLVRIECQSLTRRAAVIAACGAVRSSVQIVGL